MAAELLKSVPVEGPNGEYLRVKFHDDGTCSLRVNGTIAINRAFITPGGNHSILRFTIEPK